MRAQDRVSPGGYRARPSVGREWIRRLLVDLRGSGEVTCRDKGWPSAGAARTIRVATLSEGISEGIVSQRGSPSWRDALVLTMLRRRCYWGNQPGI
jgi:hypothetical protein